MTVIKDLVYCKKCGSDQLFRVYREGFLQEKIFPLFGYYPWRCKSCGDYMLLRKRNIMQTKHKEHIE